MRRNIVLVLVSAFMALGAGPATAATATQQDSDILAFADLSDVGDARLVRSDGGITARATARGVDPGVYTMWWMIWNTPEGCTVAFACAEADLFNPDAGLAVGFAGGAMVGTSGNLTLIGHLNEGEELTGFAYPEFRAIGVALTETTMLDSRHAEVHLVLRSHGEKIPGLVGGMLHSFNGGCSYEPPIDGSEPAYGPAGPNSCQDRYFAVFPSVDAP